LDDFVSLSSLRIAVEIVGIEDRADIAEAKQAATLCLEDNRATVTIERPPMLLAPSSMG
jgi:hypothetical protein